jgi:fatty acid amide hydrolase 2
MFQVDIHKIKFYYMEDDGGSAVVSAVHPEIKMVLRKAVLHLDKAYGIKAQKVISAANQCLHPIC